MPSLFSVPFVIWQLLFQAKISRKEFALADYSSGMQITDSKGMLKHGAWLGLQSKKIRKRDLTCLGQKSKDHLENLIT